MRGAPFRPTPCESAVAGDLTDVLTRLGSSGRLLWGIVWVGLLLRLFHYISNPSLWVDEAMLALNFLERSAAELHTPLAHGQVAPYAFLLLERGVMGLVGGGDLPLRLVPFLAGCSVMPLSLVVGRRLLPPGMLLIGLSLLAVSDPLIEYVGQIKPYSLDVAVGLLILFVVLRLRDGEGGTGTRLLLGALAVFTPWFSFSSPFVLAPSLLVLLIDSWNSRELRFATIGAGLLLTVSGAGLAFFHFGSETTGALKETWQRTGGFAPIPRSFEELLWYPRTARAVMRMPGGALLPEVGLLLVVWGGVRLFLRRQWSTVALFCGPLLLALVASALDLYPFADRLLLFAAPALMFLVAVGIFELGGRGRVRRMVLVVALALTVGTETGRAVYHVACPRVREDVRELVRILGERTQPGDVVYVYYGAGPTYRFYASDPSWRTVFGTIARRTPQVYKEELDALAGAPRVWILLSHVYDWAGLDEGRLIVDHLDQEHTRLETHVVEAGVLYLYDMGFGP